MVVYEWDPIEREYIPTDRSDDKKYITFATDMDIVCNCVCCGKEMKYGDGYTSRRFHTVHGFGYMMVSYEDIYNMRTVYATGTAEWLHVGNMSVKCSGCEEGYFARTPHCPFCGRLMKNPAPRSTTREEFRKEYDTIFFTKETER